MWSASRVIFCALAIIFVSHVNSYDLSGNKCKKEVPTRSLPRGTPAIPSGNGSTPYLSIIEICCDGYKPYEYDTRICIPDCGSKCQNGFCIKPGVCECFTDHVKNPTGQCVATCPIGCLNGSCLWNGTCLCHPGYELSSNGKFCSPKCPEGCGFRKNCTAPGLCKCLDGYVQDTSGNCMPACKMDCIHGKCVAPDICSCYPGYYLRNGTCQAKCWQNCENGRCVAENICMCNSGYEFDSMTHRCTPLCHNCLNGVCVAPEVCHCYDGYVSSNGKCLAKCKGNCLYGRCIEPNKCVCRVDYRPNYYGVCNSRCHFRVKKPCFL